MTYFESESLKANAFNGYIKFVNKSVAEKHLDIQINNDLLGWIIFRAKFMIVISDVAIFDYL